MQEMLSCDYQHILYARILLGMSIYSYMARLTLHSYIIVILCITTMIIVNSTLS